MTSIIRGLGLASPPHQMTQDEAARMFTDIVCEEERQVRLARALFRKSDVATRQTVVPHKVAYNWCQGTSASDQPAAPKDMAVASAVIPRVVPGESLGPTTRERMELYSRFAGGLAIEASLGALAAAKLAPDAITHLVTVTCTGFDAPGVDIRLMKDLGLPATTQRVQVGFMGCHGAINGLRTALAITQADANARVLLCAVELCSLHYRFTWDTEGIIGNALFADGSGALIIGGSTPPNNGSPKPATWRIVDTGSVLIADSEAAMSWSIGDHGFEMRLTSDVGDKIEAQLAPWLKQWLAARDLDLADITHWGVHPGGPRILSAVQKSLSLTDEDLLVSRSILRRFGNMSSPTVLFILNEFQRARSERQPPTSAGPCVLLGFGPGLVAEIALLSPV